MTVGSILQRVTRILSRAGLPEARRDAEQLVAHALDKSRVHLLTHPEEPFPESRMPRLARAVRRRRRFYPLQYLLERQEFYGRPFRVSPAVLIPRPETEVLVEQSLAALPKIGGKPWLGLDLGTGSGCIAVSLVREEPRLRMVAVDNSGAALRLAADNARRLQATGSVHFLQADLFSAFRVKPRFDLIVSNPPYVNPARWRDVEYSVRRYEPRGAVFAPPDGLGIYRRILAQGSRFLARRGRLMLELGYDVYDAVIDAARAQRWEVCKATRDLAGIVRCLELRLPEK